MNARTSNQPSDCPDLHTLQRFQQGALEARTLAVVADHIAVCDSCILVLDSLPDEPQGNNLVADIRRCYNHVSPPEELAYAPLAAAAVRYAVDPLTVAAYKTLAPSDAADSSIFPLAQVGPYLLLEKLGSGGMGVVYRARQTHLQRPVALKMIQGGLHATPQMLGRFRTEGRAIARLRHPNVVEIYEFDEHEGQPYLSMELLEGGSLARKLRHQELAVREAVELVRTLAVAMAAAHAADVLHRDLKPANVLLTSDGIPKISDFGLAKLLDVEESGHTQTDMVLGTPAYMAPEQALGMTRAIDVTTDVYALGVILYETLTGVVPFHGADKAATLKLVCGAEPVPPSRRRRDVPRQLEAVCLKCLEKEQRRRYGSAQALADDLGRWLRNEAPRGTPRLVARLLRTLRRRVVWVAIVVALLTTAAVVPFFHPDRVLGDIERELGAGKPVTVIAEKGPPRWMRWLSGEAKSKLEVSPEGSFTIHSQGTALLELAADSQADQYTVSARVQHLNGSYGCEIGLFVARQTYPGETEEIHFFTLLTFNDLADAEKAPIQPPFATPRRNKAHMYPRLASNKDLPAFIDNRMSGQLGQPFTISTGKSAWRQLTATVTPQGITASWEGGQPFEMSEQHIMREAHYMMKSMKKRTRFQNDPHVQALQPVYVPRGGVGLYVELGSAAFRDVMVKPLPVDK